MITIDDKIAVKLLSEPTFQLFKSHGFFCCVYRMGFNGALNGYVAVPETHSLYGKDYSDKVVLKESAELKFNGNYIGLLCTDPNEAESGIWSLDMAINVHGGLTFAADSLYGVEDSVLGNLWWFGFDTSHSGDAKPYHDEIDRKFKSLRDTEQYRDFDYVKEQTISLAQQLSRF